MRLLLVALALAAVAATARPASAHNTTWYWSQGLAETKISHSRWAINNSVQTYTIDCLGVGNWIYSKNNRRLKLYRHFDCRFTVTDYDADGFPADFETVMRLHVLGADRFTMLDDAQ